MNVRPRSLWILAAPLGLAVLTYGAFLLSRPFLEARVLASLRAKAAGAGFALTIGSLHLTPRLTLELGDVLLENGSRLQIAARTAEMRPAPSFGGLLGRVVRLSLSPATVRLPRGIELAVSASSWQVDRQTSAVRVRRREPGETLELVRADGREGRTLLVRAEHVRLDRLVSVRLHGCRLAEPGTLDGQVRIAEGPAGELRVGLRGKMQGFAFVSLAAIAEPRCPDVVLGRRTDLDLEAEALVQPRAGALRAERVRISTGGVEALGRLAIEGGSADPRIDLSFDVTRLDFARLLATAGVDLAAADLGSAALAAHVSGRLLDPASLEVTQRLDFTPPARMPAALLRFKDPFVHKVETPDGREMELVISPDSPDFVPLAGVPPLFVRALLLGEDANFFGHQGIDLSELPAAMAQNVARGAFLRGASTLSQQLAKNLLLSRRKTLARKLEEASLALLLDAALGKQRVLEIYLNIIEWGPGVYGLRPASRHYFGKEPAELTPMQIAFLVRMIPGPVKYQQSIASGVPTPFFEGLITSLLGKLEATGALTPAECQAALAQPLELRVRSDAEAPVRETSGPGAVSQPSP